MYTVLTLIALMASLAFYSAYGFRKEKTNARNGYFFGGRSLISWSIIRFMIPTTIPKHMEERFMGNSSISKYAACIALYGQLFILID